MMQLSPGQVLGRYELLLPVARGGMAEVWAARLHGSRGFKKTVAVKTILPGAIDSSRMEQMFLAEAELASRIAHPNVVQTLELGEQQGVLYLVLEWVEGESLAAVLAQSEAHGGLPLPIAVNLVGQACKGLHAAHELTNEAGESLGVVHRDISPQNILVTFSGTAKVVDFGIAKATENASTLTEAGEVKGKLAYMAPEQLRGTAHVDRRADLFSMGTLLYLMTTGVHPFRGEHPSATLTHITSPNGVAPPSSKIEDYPEKLEAVVLKALAKDVDQRFATAHEMLKALESAMPEALERSFDSKVAEFVVNVAGTSGHERRRKILAAGDTLDRARTSSQEPSSPTSLSAIAIDGAPAATPPAVDPDNTGATDDIQWRGRRGLWLGLAAVAGGTALGLSLVMGGGAQSSPAAASSPSPNATLRAASPAPRPHSDPTPKSEALPASSQDPVKSEPQAAPSAHPPKATKRATRIVRRRPVPTTAPSAPPAPAVKSPAPAPQPRTPSSNKASANAWDPDSFGARQ